MKCTIIGISLLLPQELDKEGFWKALVDKQSFLGGMSLARKSLHQANNGRNWDIEEVEGMYLEDIECFDRRLFKLSNPAAMFMDPRQRLLLQSCWGAIEDAGLRVSDLMGSKVAVFMATDGFGMGSYFRNIPETEMDAQEFIIPGNVTSFLANRISNVFDFKGPSMVVDSTCSSIYVAIHHACLSLERQECDYALVGGVSLFLEPWKSGESRPTSFESKEVGVNSFSEKASGYCSSEGCGAILIQRSDEGEDRKYEAYGRIIGSGYNSGGKTSSFARPDQQQQELLFREVLKVAQKESTDIEYIEAHGIGSRVGDAIEANALISVFAPSSVNKCFVSSVKPNIGHTHAVSGLYSLVKALMSIKYGKIPGIKGLDLDHLNKEIRHDKDGLVFLSESQEWSKKPGEEKRLAFLPSYGFSNINAALVIEEVELPGPIDQVVEGSVLICLSAGSEEQLTVYKNRLAAFINRTDGVLPLRGLAYTLQVGREPMRFRFAALVENCQQLQGSLNHDISNRQSPADVFSGDTKNPNVKVQVLMEDKSALDQLLVKSFEKGKWNQLAELWVNGINVKWNYCYRKENVRRLHLPIYPFSKNRYWVPDSVSREFPPGQGKLHPFLHRFSSILQMQRFTSTFSGKERFIADHRVKGEKIFPGVAFLEMAYAAAKLSIEQPITGFRDISWINPFKPDVGDKSLHLRLFEEKKGIAFEVYSGLEEENERELIYVRGTLCTETASQIRPLAIHSIKKRMTLLMDQRTCYDLLRKAGLEYGTGYQGIKNVFQDAEELLSEINTNVSSDFNLAPEVLDSALQACLIGTTKEGQVTLKLPFSVRHVGLFGPVVKTRWSYIKRNGGARDVHSFDILLLDDQGVVLVSFEGFVFLPLEPERNGKDDRMEAPAYKINEPISGTGKEGFAISSVQQVLVDLAASILRLETGDISIEEEFGDNGFDSIMLIQLAERLNDYYEIDLLPTVFYNCPTIESLTIHLLNEYGRTINKKHQSVADKDIITANNIPVEKRRRPGISTENNSETLRSPALDDVDGAKGFDPIAIIGMNGRFPSSDNLNLFWENLIANKDLITEVPPNRWNWKESGGDNNYGEDKTRTKWGGFIDDIDKFDALYFGISPREAELMDPQQRVSLEAVYHALEDAGIAYKSLKGSNTGIFIGVATHDYADLINKKTEHSHQSKFTTGCMHSVLTNRISYLLDLHGPSEPVDTACSSSLVAVHRAIEHLKSGQCEMAIAGGVNALLSPNLTLSFSQAGFLSPDGRCKTFDQKANGYVRGEGVGIVILKSLKKALSDGDRIHALIRSSAVNHGGKANTLTSPNPNAQKDLILKAYRSAGINPEKVGFIEAHGTGTSLGDPIEIEGLKKAFARLYEERRLKPPGQPHIHVGSVKTNIGHLEAAAGIAGLLKVVLALKHKMIPGNPQLEKPNEFLQLQNSPFVLSKETIKWDTAKEEKRLAGVSSFGFGGSNAHIVIEEYEMEPGNFSDSGAAVVLLSGKNRERLKRQAGNLESFLRSNQNIKLSDLAYTLQVGREHLEERLALVVNDLEELAIGLQKFGAGDSTDVFTSKSGNYKIDGYSRDPAAEAGIIAAIEDNNIKSLAQLWSRGAKIDWNLIYTGKDRPQKIGLPQYPFSRVRHWIRESPASSGKKLKLSLIRDTDKNLPNKSKSPTIDKSFPTKEFTPAIVRNKPGELNNRLSRELAEILYLESSELNVDKPFSELGLDSILGVEWLKWINNTFNVNLKISKLYDYPTISALATHLEELMANNTDTGPDKRIGLTSPGEERPVRTLDKSNLQTIKGRLDGPDGITFTYALSNASNPFLNHHLVFNHHVMPTDGFVEVICTTLEAHFGLTHLALKDIQIHQPLIVRQSDNLSLLLNIKELDNENIRFVISSHDSGEARAEKIHLRGFLEVLEEESIQFANKTELGENVKIFTEIDIPSLVPNIEISGIYSGLVPELEFGYREARGKIKIESEHTMGIALIVSGGLTCAMTFGAYLMKSREPENENSAIAYIPYRVEKIFVYASQSPGSFECLVSCNEIEEDRITLSFDVLDTKGRSLLSVKKLQLIKTKYDQINGLPAVRRDDPKKEEETTNPIGEMKTPDVAIIGLSCRLPGAPNQQIFWTNLKEGIDAIEEIDEGRWGDMSWYHPDKNHAGTSYSKWAGFIEDSDKFDPLFFGISPKEAEIIDPQQRIFLEECWKCIEDAAYDPAQLAGRKVGVFVGAGAGDYLHLMQNLGAGLQGAAFTGNSQAILAARISYFLNLKGPALSIDTACSSSLVAIDRAYKSILFGECEMALAGGVSLLTTPTGHIWTSRVGMPSQDGRCKTFDDRADGIVSSEGVGVVLLKSLDKALEDGDRIYGVIKGSGVNQDGKTNGITAPSAHSQAELQQSVYDRFKIQARTISYIEAHGTGTKLGDPIEVDALTQSFGKQPTDAWSCALGSVKTNIGHAGFAAGVSGVIKTLLMLHYKKLVPSLHYEMGNEKIEFGDSPFYVNTKLKPWTTNEGQIRRAAVSSFGFSGTNAHLVLEEFEQQSTKYKGNETAIILLSARNKDRLSEHVSRLAAFLDQHKSIDLYDMAYTLQVGRAVMDERMAVMADNIQELKNKLHAFLNGRTESVMTGNTSDSKVGFFLEGSAGKAYISAAIKDKEIKSLAQLWLMGFSVDWNLLYTDNNRPNKITLPAYPFARKRYWYTSKGKSAEVQESGHKFEDRAKLILTNAHKETFDQKESLAPDSKSSMVKLDDLNNFLSDPSITTDHVELKENIREAKETRAPQPSLSIGISSIRERLKDLIKIELFLDEEVKVNKQFADYGMDSILGVEFIKSINEEFGLHLLSADLYEYPTIEEMATYISETRQDHKENHVVEKITIQLSDATESAVKSPVENGKDFISKAQVSPLHVNSAEGSNGTTKIQKIHEGYAIVAASGQFAFAENTEELWHKSERAIPLSITADSGQDIGLAYGRLLSDDEKDDLTSLGLDDSHRAQLTRQERLIFNVISKALAESNLSRDVLSSRPTGVFIAAQQEYTTTGQGAVKRPELAYLIPNKVSFYLNLQGPSELVNSYCASSFVALHRAIQSIASGECEQAIVGGVNTIPANEIAMTLEMDFGTLFSKDGKTKSFCQDAGGFVRSEGAGIVVIKPLVQAEQAGDRILGIVKGSSVQHGGKGFSLMAPSAKGIKKAVSQSLAVHGLEADTIDYIEAHGIANPTADAIELTAIDSIYKELSKNPHKKWHIGSVKPTIGHSELASGIASILKVLKAFENETIPGIAGLETVNSELDPNHSLILSKSSKCWKNGHYPRRAALNSYAVGGVNAHIILEEYIQKISQPLLEKPNGLKASFQKMDSPIPEVRLTDVNGSSVDSISRISGAGHYDVIVIGAGISGLISSCYLAMRGKKVLVLEAHNIPGGYLQNYYRKGRQVDAISAVVPDPYNTPIFKEVFNELNIDQEWIAAPLSQNRIGLSDDWQTILFEDPRKTGKSPKDCLISSFVKMLPAYTAGINGLFEEMFDEDRHNKNFDYYAELTLGEFLKKHIPKDSHHYFYNPFANPTEDKWDTAYLPYKKLFNTIVATTQYYPKGSWKKLIENLTNKLKEYGGTIKYRHRVVGFDAEDDHIKRVNTKKGSFESESVLVCGSPFPLLTKINNCHLPSHAPYIQDLSERIPCAPSIVLTVFFDEVITEKLTTREKGLLHGIVYFDDPALSSFEDRFDTEQLYVVCPTSIDPSLSEKGDYIIATSTVKYISENFWRDNKSAIQTHFEKLFFTAFASLRDVPHRIELATPLTIERFTLNYKGAISGWATTPDQIGENTLSHFTAWRNLFLAGHWVFPGPRIPWAMESAKSVVFELSRYLHKTEVLEGGKDGAYFRDEENGDINPVLSFRENSQHRSTDQLPDCLSPVQKSKIEELFKGILGLSLDAIQLSDSIHEYEFGSIKLMRLLRSINEEFSLDMKMGQILGVDDFQMVFDLLEAAILKKGQPTGLFKSEVHGSDLVRYPLSEGQKGLWIAQQAKPHSTIYNIPVALSLKGPLDVESLYEIAERQLVMHPILTAKFGLDRITGELYQEVRPTADRLSRDVVDIQDGQRIEDIFKHLIQTPFDLSKEVFRLHIRKDTKANNYYLLFVIHHIVFDGTSGTLLASEFTNLFKQIAASDRLITLTKDINFFDLIEWEKTYLASENGKVDLAFWRNHLKGDLEKLELPYDVIPNSMLGDDEKEGNEILHLQGEILVALKEVAKAQKVNPSVFLLSVFKVLLFRITNKKDLIVKMPVTSRPREKYERSIGFYVNILLSRTTISGDERFVDLMKILRSGLTSAMDHMNYPYPKLLTELQLSNGEADGLFPVSYNYLNIFDEFLNSEGGERISFMEGIYQELTDEYALEITDFNDEITIYLKYRTDLFTTDTARRHLKYYKRILDEVITNPLAKIDEIELLDEEESNRILYDFNNTKNPFPKRKTIVDLFETQVQKTPDNPAVIFRDKQLTYKKLNQRANSVAHFLRTTYDIQPDDIVALRLNRSEWMNISILGVMKAGAAYMPLSQDYPEEKVWYMLKDSRARVLLTDESMHQGSMIWEKLLPVIKVESIKGRKKSNPKKKGSSRNLAYIIYTSGSTGQPKGVMIEHRALVNRLNWMQNAYPIGVEDCILQKTPYTFDVSVWELLWWSLQGARVVMLEPGAEKEPSKIVGAVKNYGVTTLHFVPAMLGTFLNHLRLFPVEDELNSLRKVFASGEALKVSHVKQFYKFIGHPEVALQNLYGPTEASIDVSYYDCSALGDLHKVPIGRPIDNVKLYILNNEHKINPIGVAGELCIGGVGLARGYLNNPALTAQKFISSPFEEGGRLYKTGDLARWLTDGNIDFLGRIDNQLKIRGYRIESGEVEQAIMTHPDIHSAVVTTFESGEGVELIAYLQPIETSFIPDVDTLRKYLSQKLPDYMIPSYFMELQHIPLTSSGKVNRKALPTPDSGFVRCGKDYAAARTPTEQSLVILWEKLLERKPIGINDHFFHIGGHSLKAVRLVALIQQKLSARIELNDIFSHPTVAGLAVVVSSATSLHPSRLATIPHVATRKAYDLSNAQRRLWVLDQMEKEQIAYNMPVAIRLKGHFDPGSLENSIQLIFERHESLRTNFIDGKQVIRSRVDFELAINDFTGIDKTILENKIRERAIRHFDLKTDTLLLFELLKIGYQDHVLLFNMHHIISDGWSLGILAKEISVLYNASIQGIETPSSALTSLALQYKDYAAWQNELLASGKLEASRKFWLEKLTAEDGQLPVLVMPADFPRPSIKTYNGARRPFMFSSQVLEKIMHLAQGRDCTLFMCLTAIVKVLLYRYSGQTDIIIGTPTAGRDHPHLHDQIGFYVNTLVLRSEISGSQSFSEFLDRVKMNALSCFEHQYYPFDRLVEDLDLSRDTSRSAVFDVMLDLQNNDDFDIRLGEVEVSLDPIETGTSKFDLTFSFTESSEGLHLGVEYNTDLYLEETIDRLIGHLEYLINNILIDPDESIDQLNILPETEKQLICHEFNETASELPTDTTIIDLFEEQVKLSPGKIALISGEFSLTYSELDQKSNILARYLKTKHQLRQEDIIALQLERSEWMVIAILGVLKAGAAFLPIAPDIPSERMAFILKDSRAKVLLTDKTTFPRASRSADVTVVVPIEGINHVDSSDLKKTTGDIHTSKSLAYVLYTSGSTGQPKGVMIEHRPLLNFLLSMSAVPGFTTSDTMLSITNYTFDISILEIGLPLINGGSLVLASSSEQNTPHLLQALIDRTNPTYFQATPSLWSLLLKGNIKGLKHMKLLCGGEALPQKLADQLYSEGKEAWNMYGPTETTIWSTVLKLDAGERVSIGKPIANTSIFILDNSLNILPIGVPGHLYIGGAGLARGYLNNLELTNSKFISSPFNESDKLYKTGDLARWLNDGNIEFLGRIDYQLKIRGYRIEAGEVEQALMSHPGIKEALVMANGINEHKDLVAYYIAEQMDNVSINDTTHGVSREGKLLKLSLFHWGDTSMARDSDNPYVLLKESAVFADKNGFEGIWIPERHFDPWGGQFPSPSVLAGSIASITSRIKIRSGSVVAPLHHPVRIAENWSVVDNLSNGRVQMSFASGWAKNDFILNPQNYDNRRKIVYEYLDIVERLWKGQQVNFKDSEGTEVAAEIFPKPIQPELPVFITVAGNPDSAIAAARKGKFLLTHLLGKEWKDVRHLIDIYRKTWKESGHPGEGYVVVMVHTFIGSNKGLVKEIVEKPLTKYLKNSTMLGLKNNAEASNKLDKPLADRIFKAAFNRYYDESYFLEQLTTA